MSRLRRWIGSRVRLANASARSGGALPVAEPSRVVGARSQPPPYPEPLLRLLPIVADPVFRHGEWRGGETRDGVMTQKFPIRISSREGDPNVGRRPSEDKENRRSGYVPIYSEEEGAADLEHFAQFEAHFGGTAGGFAFGSGTAQLGLETLRITLGELA